MKSLRHAFRQSVQGLALLAAAVMLGAASGAQAAMKLNVDFPSDASPTFVYATGGDTDPLNDTLTADVGVTLHVTDDAGHPLADGIYDARLRFHATVADVVTWYSPGSGALAMDLFFAGSAVFEDALGHALLTARFGVAPEAAAVSMRLLSAMPPPGTSGFVVLIPGLSGRSLDGGADLFEFGGALAGYDALATGLPQELLFHVLGLRADGGGLIQVGSSEPGAYHVANDFTFDSFFVGRAPLHTKAPIPEPATLPLIVAGVVTLLARRGRRR